MCGSRTPSAVGRTPPPSPGTGPATAVRHRGGDTGLPPCALTALPEGRLDCPLTALFAPDDPLARGHEETARNWKLFSDTVRFEMSDDGGHYLNATHPERIAAVLRADLGL
ncbi:hypothetical protein [Streptomyces dangxiongensis]|uniref:hypothetical protein n=1 Tax=Streptomyces dangxiongensis TaxID=1442032 RepID=UPI0013CEA827|nr:hypothetical protein [Streptomyces dangxiongensis]